MIEVLACASALVTVGADMKAHAPLLWVSVGAIAVIGGWQGVAITERQERLAASLQEERSARRAAEERLHSAIEGLAKTTNGELSKVADSIATMSSKMDGVGSQSKRSTAILDSLYVVRESGGEVVAVAPRNDEGALGLRK